MNNRIASLDGWRALAAVGVLYGHAWGLFYHPSWMVGGVDLMQVFYLWGYGVHLFFVISGFCFYKVLSGQPFNGLRTILTFWGKRWLRIAPAFYFACIVYVLLYYSRLAPDLSYRLLCNFIFVQNYFPNYGIEGIFWSLAVEWHFYLLLPLIFSQVSRYGVMRTVGFILILHILLNLAHYRFFYPYKEIPFLVDGWWYTIFCNIGHFAWGILAGHLYATRRLSGLFSRWWSLLAGLALAYTGRVFIYSGWLVLAGPARSIFQATGPLLMTLGFAWMILASLESRTLSRIWGNRWVAGLGRISYSFYLWHNLVLEIVFYRLKGVLPFDAWGVLLTMLLVLIILIPVSWISYRLFESFYFRRTLPISSRRE